MLELKNISKSFRLGKGKKVVLDNVSIKIEDGKMVAIMGASGSGKTTLLNILGCMEKPDDGEYVCNGENITAMNVYAREKFRRDNIGYVFQQFALINDITVFNNIALPLKARNVPRRERKRLVSEYADKLGIGDQLKKLPTLISGGQQQRCAIARALVTGNQVILADEPTGALDKKTGIEIMGLLRKLTDDKKTVIVVTHDEHVAAMADYIIRIEDGRIL